MSKANLSCKKHVLLTGAGFTKNFGGFLGDEMWTKIFNDPRIQQIPRLKSLLLSNCQFNYENAYQVVLDSYPDEEKNIFTQVLLSAYESLDRSIMDRNRFDTRIRMHQLNELLSRFAGSHDEKGLIFTLNQDIFFERYYWDRKFRFSYLGLEAPFFNDDLKCNSVLEESDFVNIPNEQITGESASQKISSSNSFYVKLHGSFHWKTANGQHLMIVGEQKGKRVEEVPLLGWYREIFNKVINQGNVRLLIIGYGFRDEHINLLIWNAMLINGTKLQIFIVSPEPVSEMKQRLVREYEERTSMGGKQFADQIFSGLGGYFQLNLKDIFLNHQLQKTEPLREIERCFFGL